MSAVTSALTEDRVDELNRKLEVLTEQVGLLAQQAQAARARRDEWDELRADVVPLSRDAFLTLMTKLDEYERRGYFEFAKGGAEVLDRVVSSFGEDDLQQLGDNIVLMLTTIREMTQPELMRMLRRTAFVAREEEPEDVSLFQLLKRLNDPAVKRGLDRMLRMLHTVEIETEAAGPPETAAPGAPAPGGDTEYDPAKE